jgi:hypothetical protein
MICEDAFLKCNVYITNILLVAEFTFSKRLGVLPFSSLTFKVLTFEQLR